VAEAYLKPNANRDATKFEWPLPKLHRIRDYCREILGWTENEVGNDTLSITAELNIEFIPTTPTYNIQHAGYL
jgi:hypothetical protein